MRLSGVWLLSALLLVIGCFWPRPNAGFGWAVIAELIKLLPLILFVSLLAGWAASGRLIGKINTLLDRGPMRGIIVASVIGAVTPVCGIAVAPIVAALLRQGLPLGVAMAFWLSSPISDPGMIVLTAGILGWGFAVAKLFAALLLGLVAGVVALCLEKRFPHTRWLRSAAVSPGSASGCHTHSSTPWLNEALDTFWLVGRWLTLALIIEALLRSQLKEVGLASLLGADSSWAVPLAVAVGGPLYIESYAALPLLRGFIDAGLSPGAAMAFLISGAAISFYAAIAVWSLVRPVVFALYLTLGLVGALLIGWGVDSLGWLGLSG